MSPIQVTSIGGEAKGQRGEITCSRLSSQEVGGQRSDPGPLAPEPVCWPTGASPLAAGVPPAAHGRPWQTPQIGRVSADPEPYDIRQKPLLPEKKDRKSFYIVQRFVFFKPNSQGHVNCQLYPLQWKQS